MALEVVDLYCLDDTVAHAPIQGLICRFFQPDGYTFIQQATTDSSGHCPVMLDAPGSYQVRFYKLGVSIQQPVGLGVLLAPAPPLSNRFQVQGHVYSPPEAQNPRLCRCAGFFQNPDGSPAQGLEIQLSPKFSPLLVDGVAMMTERIRILTDQTGFAQTDLVRYGQYDAQVKGMEDWLNEIEVPNLPACNLPDLLFPVVTRIVLSPTGPYNVAKGQDLVINPTIYWSDGNITEGSGVGDVQWSTDNLGVAAVIGVSTLNITVRGIDVGNANLVASRADTSITKIPDTPISGVPVGISVS